MAGPTREELGGRPVYGSRVLAVGSLILLGLLSVGEIVVGIVWLAGGDREARLAWTFLPLGLVGLGLTFWTARHYRRRGLPIRFVIPDEPDPDPDPRDDTRGTS